MFREEESLIAETFHSNKSDDTLVVGSKNDYIVDENVSISNETLGNQNETSSIIITSNENTEQVIETATTSSEETIAMAKKTNESFENLQTVSKENNSNSSEVFETRYDLNASSEVVTTRYFSSEETNSTEVQSIEIVFNLTTQEPTFSEEKLEAVMISVENKNITGTNESSEAIMTMYHHVNVSSSEEPSEEAITTRYLSLDSAVIESFEDEANGTRHKSEEDFDLTTVDPSSSSSSEYVEKITRVDNGKLRSIILIANESEETSTGSAKDGDEEFHILQAKPEVAIPLYGITSKEAYEMVEETAKNREMMARLTEKNSTVSETTINPFMNETYG